VTSTTLRFVQVSPLACPSTTLYIGACHLAVGTRLNNEDGSNAAILRIQSAPLLAISLGGERAKDIKSAEPFVAVVCVRGFRAYVDVFVGHGRH
jgi:hypothetical protein